MLVSSFMGSNRDFRVWLYVRTRNVVDLAVYRKKKKAASRAALRKLFNPSIA